MSDPMTDETILPCPWCGKAPLVERLPARVMDSVPERFVARCIEGGCEVNPRGAQRATRRDAIDDWNRRAPSAVARS